MTSSPNIRRRRFIRLYGYNYSQNGAYFITVCTYRRRCLFGNIVNGEMVLNDAGEMIQNVWLTLELQFSNVCVDEYSVMPNHFHGIVVLDSSGGSEPKARPDVSPGMGPISNMPPNDICGSGRDEPCGRPHGTLPGSLSRVVQGFKSMTTHQYVNGVQQNGWPPFPGKLWQRSYFERIIRNDDEWNKIRQYIVDNPIRWECDRENLEAKHPVETFIQQLHRDARTVHNDDKTK